MLPSYHRLIWPLSRIFVASLLQHWSFSIFSTVAQSVGFCFCNYLLPCCCSLSVFILYLSVFLLFLELHPCLNSLCGVSAWAHVCVPSLTYYWTFPSSHFGLKMFYGSQPIIILGNVDLPPLDPKSLRLLGTFPVKAILGRRLKKKDGERRKSIMIPFRNTPSLDKAAAHHHRSSCFNLNPH